MPASALHAAPKNLPVVVTVLGNREIVVTGSVVEISGPNMFLKAAQELPQGRSVKVKAEDTMWLAEVIQCTPAEGEYAVSLDIAHTLNGLGDLARLAERLLDRPARELESSQPVDSRATQSTIRLAN